MLRRTFFSVLVILTFASCISAQTDGLSKMWKGKDLWVFGQSGKYAGSETDWHAMPGATLSFSYAGKGPLPAPQEFVVTLDAPLPLGTYRLFVKNFYRGKMEATVGDITKPLTIRRYEWTPGVLFETNAPVDRIVLRYFPSDIVADTGAEQSQMYIVQGVYFTTEVNKVPIKGGEIITTLPEEKPDVQNGNYLLNADFEAGLFPWGKPFGKGGAYGPENLDDSTAGRGKYSFKHTLDSASGSKKDGGDELILESRNYRLSPGRYTVSFYAKADKPVLLSAGLSGATEDLKDYAGAGLAKAFALTDQWHRYSVTGELQALAGFLYTLQFSVRAGSPATVWVDAVQLQNGEATDFQPAKSAEVGYVCHTIGNVFYHGQSSDVDVLVFDASGAGRADVSYQVVDYWGEQVELATRQVAVTDQHGRLTLSLPAKKRGIFRVLFSLGDSTSEMTYSVLPANGHLNTKYPQGSLGVDTHFGEKQLAILKRANFNWVMSKFLGRWYLVERERGKYQFDDESIARAEKAKMMVLLQPLNIDWGMQEWLKPYWKPQGGAVWEPQKKNEYVGAWGRFVYELATHYKGTVKHWEIENEPFAPYSHDEYAELLKVAVENLRKADPEAKVVAFAGGGLDEKGYERVLNRVEPSALDVFCVHFYGGNEAGVYDRFSKLLKKYGKPGWNTETGTTCPTFFTTLPEYEALRRKDYLQSVQQEVRLQPLASCRTT